MPAGYYFSDQSGKLHSERGMPNVPVYESLCKMMPAEDMWPIGEMWGKHDFTRDGAQKATSYISLLAEAFGECNSAEEFCTLGQWLNYEGYRAMFESANAAGRMGLLLWMSHSCWPSAAWCTYDYYYQPGAAFFACKKACEPLHIQYNPISSSVEVVNICRGNLPSLTAELGIYDYKGALLGRQTATVDSPDDSTVSCLRVDFPDGTESYLLKLRLLSEDGEVLSDNFYMLPRVTPCRPAGLSHEMKISGNSATVTVRNSDDVPALLVRLSATDRKGGEILPIEYSDNWFSLLPGEEKTVQISWEKSGFRGRPALKLQQLGDFRAE